ncbi:hypothetical protein SeMB42_g05088 [Synchytrium endobioticum]|uniref:Condensin complex subunit 1 n=1 Tax=Synchytrium endobioticum TaxID=286115 RepID=A0A507CTP5_9FUNG|nr:hypothetical protein SeMB42_g05088 [Synchytrium endobioticum]TPX43862.1 hypothetical protein SeLEV6574_g04830 [Synchytrium endobioticum]
MEDMPAFDLHETLSAWQHGTQNIDNEFDASQLDPDELNRRLDDISHILLTDPASLSTADAFDSLQSCLKYLESLEPSTIQRVGDVIVNGLERHAENVATDIEEANQANFDLDRTFLEMYTFLLYWLMMSAEKKAKSDASAKERANIGKPKKGRLGKSKLAQASDWDWPSQKLKALKVLFDIFSLELKRIWISSAERDAYINMVTKCTSLLLEDADNVKKGDLRAAIFDIWALAVINYNYSVGAQASVLLNLKSGEEHLAESMADFLELLARKHDTPTLAEDVLRDIGNMEFCEKDHSKIAKTFSKFLVRLADILPRQVLKQLVTLQVHLDSDSTSIRSAMIEVVGILIHNLLAVNNSEIAAGQLNTFYGIIQDRFKDSSAYVRVKVLQVLLKLTEPRVAGGTMTDIPVETRPAIVDLVIGRLYDKSSLVRKNAIKLLTKMMDTSPFVAFPKDDGKLNLTLFESRRNEIMQIITAKYPNEASAIADLFELSQHGAVAPAVNGGPSPSRNTDMNDMDLDSQVNLDKDHKRAQPERAPATNYEDDDMTAHSLAQFQKLLKYYTDAIKFCQQLMEAIPALCELLSSKIKSEAAEAMRFFVEAHGYSVEGANIGVRTMVHKIWDKDTDAESDKGIREDLIDAYERIHFKIVSLKTDRQNLENIVYNLIRLTEEMNLAELTSLEQLLSIMIVKERVQPEQAIIDCLWGIFGRRRTDATSARERRGAIMVLSMLAKARKDIIVDKTDVLLRVGLGDYGKEDMLLARFACVAFQMLGATERKKGTLSDAHKRLPMDNIIFQRIREMLLDAEASEHWFEFAEQGLNTIYLLSEHPDMVCGEIIKALTSRVLNVPTDVDDTADKMAADLTIAGRDDGFIMNGIQNSQSSSLPESRQVEEKMVYCDSLGLAKLCFMVGHAAIKQIVHLESIEVIWKRRKAAEDTAKTPGKRLAADELDNVTGSTEDEFTEAINYIREHELILGEESLLAAFAPIVVEICKQNSHFSSPLLQTHAVLALSKFMCVSSEFCDSNLQLLLTVLEKSKLPVVRLNTIIGIGDLTVCFNSLMDQNVGYLYKRLNDPDEAVKKNTLMVLTHLILNGMVKVKGQISEMAKCLEDENQRISDLAKLFFTELASKDNAVYNNLPDIISNLSQPAPAGVEEETFKSIMRFLFDFIKKDKQTENIVEKLVLRFKNADTDRQCRDIAFCLASLPFSSEKSIKKLVDGIPHYQDKLYEPTVWKHFQDILSKAKKAPRTDGKTILEEFERRLADLREKALEQQETVANAMATRAKHTKMMDGVPAPSDDMEEMPQDVLTEALAAMSFANGDSSPRDSSARGKTSKTAGKTRGRKAGPSRSKIASGRKRKPRSDDDDREEDVIQVETSDEENRPPPSARKDKYSSRSSTPKRTAGRTSSSRRVIAQELEDVPI